MATPPPTRDEVLEVFGGGIQLVGKSSQVFCLQTIILKANETFGTFKTYTMKQQCANI